MKRLVFFLFFVFSFLTTHAISIDKSCCESSTFSFMGMSMRSKYDDLKRELISSGFTLTSKRKIHFNQDKYQGMYKGQKISIDISYKGNVIKNITLYFCESTRKWNELELTYYDLKKKLIYMYASPTICNDGFKCVPFDNEKMLESIESGEARYRSFFKNKDERANLQIDSFTCTKVAPEMDGKKYGEDEIYKDYFVILSVSVN